MDADLSLAVGVVLLVLSIPSLLSAYVDARMPRVAVIMIAAGSVLIAMAMTSRPGGYSLAEVPQVFLAVIARYIY